MSNTQSQGLPTSTQCKRKSFLLNLIKIPRYPCVRLKRENLQSAIIQCKSPVKYKDPGCPTISKLGLGKLKPTSIALSLANRSMKIPRGMIEDVLVQVDKFYYPVDFVVLDMDPIEWSHATHVWQHDIGAQHLPFVQKHIHPKREEGEEKFYPYSMRRKRKELLRRSPQSLFLSHYPELKYAYLEEDKQCLLLYLQLTIHQEDCLLEVLRRCQYYLPISDSPWEVECSDKKDHFPLPFIDQYNKGLSLGTSSPSKALKLTKQRLNSLSSCHPNKCQRSKAIPCHVGFYRRFIKDFSKLARPLCELLVKDAKFIWDDRCQRSFEELKLFLTTAPIVRAPNWQLPFEVMCDASDFDRSCSWAKRRWKTLCDLLREQDIE
ncbi:hypothetical protein CK203_053424 [Vitis vinifera]|uniref:Reverse transcriptase/retrotransposon-derived protein RNase H-like domain-containing protein n=1 Tax=Vitis vinifera TaxID=29760 RepID=A0A438GZL8_VITVI|nr:hypothetical protein CK203_053424 [Vitis vinifera]